MPKKSRWKNFRKMPAWRARERAQRRQKWWRFERIRYFVMAGVMAASSGLMKSSVVMAETCPELSIVFARGSGAERETNKDFAEFKRAIENKIGGWGLSHKYIDLDYEAKGIGVDNVWTLVGAFFGAGDAYDFGASVDEGVAKLTQLIQACPKTKFVLGGYSQGAMVVSQAIHSIDAERVIYAATFGDPKLYLPEGKAWFAMAPVKPFTGSEKNLLRTGSIPAACRGENLSDYRMYVPDCYAYEGMLGSYRPYEPLRYAGKLGTWCNKYDMFCSSYLSAASHTSYVTDGLYEDASRVIADKIARAFGVVNSYTSPHDTAILVDTTGSMDLLIDDYKEEILRLTEKTLNTGGRVALYDYRDLGDPYQVTKRCDFETCNYARVAAELEALEIDGGGDRPESLLSASFNMMQELEWRAGSTKSLVVITDAGYHNPDLDGREFVDVVRLSKEIDPVNFYVVTKYLTLEEYEELITATGGRAVSSVDELHELVDYISERYDSLPRVEEVAEFDAEAPAMEVTSVEDDGDNVTVRFKTSGSRVMVILNDAVLGVSEDDSATISELDRSISNTLRLVPLTDQRRGEAAIVEIEARVPRVPDTGKVK